MGRTRTRWTTRWTIAWILGLVPAGVLCYAALLKGLDPRLFADQISGHKLTPDSWSPALAHFLIAAEMILAFALALRLWPRLSHLAFIALMLGFITATVWAWTHGNAKECGCFGRAVSRGPRGVIVEDGVLILLSAATFFLWRGFRTSRWSVIATAILLTPVLAFTVAGDRLPADSFITSVRPGSDMSDVAIEDLRRSQSDGTALMVLVSGTCPACEKGIADLNEIARRHRDVNVFAVYAGTRQEATNWRLRLLPAFPVAHGSARAMRAYYRTLPASFLLRNGKVVRVFWGRIPSNPELTAILPPG